MPHEVCGVVARATGESVTVEAVGLVDLGQAFATVPRDVLRSVVKLP